MITMHCNCFSIHIAFEEYLTAEYTTLLLSWIWFGQAIG